MQKRKKNTKQKEKAEEEEDEYATTSFIDTYLKPGQHVIATCACVKALRWLQSGWCPRAPAKARLDAMVAMLGALGVPAICLLDYLSHNSPDALLLGASKKDTFRMRVVARKKSQKEK